MLAAGSGKIVNIGARAGLKGAGRMGAYCASKSVVIRLTESLADELKGSGINVNCILPSVIDTARNRQDMPDADSVEVGGARRPRARDRISRLRRRTRNSWRRVAGGSAQLSR